MAKRLNAREKHRQIITAAMPEVKKLCRRFGRTAVGNCVAKIAAWEREAKKLNALRKEVTQMERRLRS
jgi:hypothetical protein